ncbi:hypothetical protein WKI13_02370 [Teredinibacter turnerae]|uniref:hypothetical protein n=1 Tax=Teredinibacter turnerae TaxID=2426 RepID=UPI0003725BB6|nr:hypothetical protein [Teredinibacter turnerae]
MSRIYRISADLDHYMMCTLDDLDLLEKMEDFNIDALGTPLPFNWVAPSTAFIPSDDGGEQLPDITQWSTNDLIVSQDALTKLTPLLTPDRVEDYPLEGDAARYRFINPIKRLGNHVVDHEHTTASYYDDGTVEDITRLVLKQSATTDSPPLFTLDIDGGVSLYCNEAFYRAITQHDLNGLIFTEIAQH